MNAVLADAIVAVHVGYVGFIVIGMILIPVGGLRGWRRVRNRWFRSVHLLMIAYVAFESLAGIPCPLTVWEEQLRTAAGQPIEGDSFVGRCLHGLLFCHLPEWALTLLYVAATAAVAATLRWIPPQWRS